MISNTFGDLARTFSTQSQLGQLKRNVTTLSTELSTGRKSNIPQHLQGDMGRPAALERAREIAQRYLSANAETQFTLGVVQSALAQIDTSTGDIGQVLLRAGAGTDPTGVALAGTQARQTLTDVIAALNIQAADRSVFSGPAPRTRPLADAETLLSALDTAAQGATTLAEARQAISDWFDDPAGFATVMYRGATDGALILQASETADLSVDLRADDPLFKDVLEELSFAVLTAEPGLPGTSQTRSTALTNAGEALLSLQTRITESRGQIGVLEARAEAARVEIQAASFAYDTALGTLYGADPYETATDLEAAITSLDTLFATTARLSALSLTRYL